MSWSDSFSQNYVDPAHLAEAEQQIEVFTGIVSAACQEKCIPHKYHDGDLHKGEQKCVDRCVAKYMSIQTLVGQSMKHLVPNQHEQQQ
ncbi:Tim10/DDP family zinc finger-domain-containing protein [Pilobolus umbonatus]|nr:Tim10/DDP family zinc finger-domain-containing protein [Pilobolus umbonatus]